MTTMNKEQDKPFSDGTSRIVEINQKSKLFEKELLGVIFFDHSKVIQAKTIISPEDFIFYREHFETYLDCYIHNKNLTSEFSSKSLTFSDFANEFSRRNINDICQDIKEAAIARRIFEVLERSSQKITTRGVHDFVSDLHQKLVKASRDTTQPSEPITSLINDFRASQVDYRTRYENGGGIIGVSTGFQDLDEMIDGLRPGHLWIIGGYAASGKTTAVLNIIANLVKQGKRVVFYSMEMSPIDILARLIGIMTNQSGIMIMKDMPHDRNAVQEALNLIEQSGLTVISGGQEISQISFSAFEESMKKPVDLFAVDFLQLVTVKGAKNDYETITNAILEIQNMAKKLKTPFIVLSQVSNESAKFNDSVVMGFKGSGAIAAAADFAIEININEESKERWKEKMKLGEEIKMRWNVKKNRHGRGGYVDMFFMGKTGIYRKDDGEIDWGDWTSKEKKKLQDKNKKHE